MSPLQGFDFFHIFRRALPYANEWQGFTLRASWHRGCRALRYCYRAHHPYGMAGDVIDMRIYVVARGYFEGMRGRSEEREALGAFRVISINATGEDPPFGVEFLGLPTLLVLRFDDVSESYEDGVFMTSQDAKRVIDFVAEESPEKPLVIHCTAGVSRSGAVGEVLNDWLNRIVSPNEADYERFRREHPYLVPNTHVRRLLLAEIERRMAL